MCLIKVNFDNVADEIKPIPPGSYVGEMKESSIEVSKKGKDQLVVKFDIQNEGGVAHGRTISSYFGLDNEFGQVGMKRLCKAAGVTVGSAGFDASDLIGRHAK